MGLVIVLAVFLIAGVTVLANAIDLTVRTIYRYTEYFTYVLPQQRFKAVPEAQRLIVASDPRVERTMEGAFFLCNIKTVMGRLPFVVLGVPDDDRDYLMKRMGTTLIAGRLPAEGMPEAVLSEPMVENKKLKIGDNVVSPTEVGGMATAAPVPVKLVGILKGPIWVGFTSRSFCTNYFLLNPHCTLYTWKDIHQRDTLNRAMMPVKDKAAGKLSPTEVQVLSKENLITEVRESLESLYMIMGVVTAAVIFAITLMSGMLANIYFTQRLSEFGVLAAIGYSRPQADWASAGGDGAAQCHRAGLLGRASTALLMRFLGESVFRARGLFLRPTGPGCLRPHDPRADLYHGLLRGHDWRTACSSSTP